MEIYGYKKSAYTWSWSNTVFQLSSVSGPGRLGLAVWLLPWKDPAGRRSPLTTAKTDPAACRTLLRRPVERPSLPQTLKSFFSVFSLTLT